MIVHTKSMFGRRNSVLSFYMKQVETLLYVENCNICESDPYATKPVIL